MQHLFIDYTIPFDSDVNKVTTMYELIERAVRLNGKSDFVGEQFVNTSSNTEYLWVTYEQVGIRTKII